MVRRTVIALCFTLNAALLSHAQLIQVRPPQTVHCLRDETITPNLRVARQSHIFGVVGDASGETWKRSPVELKIYVSNTKQIFMKKVITDESGKFDLGNVDAGSYRILASPTRAFKQPSPQVCEQHECSLRIMLSPASTDQPTFNCPVR